MRALVVLLAHGSPDPRSSQGACDVAHRLGKILPGTIVRVAYLNHDWPTLTAAIGRERDAGEITTVKVLPLLLSKASHALRDVPDAVAQAERDHRIKIEVGETIGMKLDLALALDAQVPAGLPIVLAWAGGRTAIAQAETQLLVDQWHQATGRQIVAAGSSESGEHLLAAAVELQERTTQMPMIATFTLFPGVLADQVQSAADAIGTRATTPLFAETALIQILADRLSEHPSSDVSA